MIFRAGRETERVLVEPMDAAALIAAALLVLPLAVRAQSQPSVLPPDPELAKPLPPIAARPDPPPLAAGAPEGPAADAATSPPADPELAIPLQPLDSFTVDTRPSGAAAPRPAQVLYRFDVEGLDPASQVMKAFRAGSALAKGKGRADDAAQLGLRVRDDELALKGLLRSFGYYDAKVAAQVTPAASPAAPAQVKLSVERGGQYRLGAIAVTGPATRPPGLPRQDLPLKSGEPIVAPVVEAAEAQVRLRLPQQGYPFVKVGQRDVALDEATHTGDYTLPVDPGARSRFGQVSAKGDTVLTGRALAVMPRFRQGDLYDSRLVDDLRRALVSTGLYGSVTVADRDTGRTVQGDEVVDLDVTGQRGKTHIFSATAGYDTGLGATAGLSWTDTAFLKPEGALTVRGLYGTQQSLAGVTLRDNNFPLRDESLQYTAQVSQESIDPYDARTAQVGVTLARESTPIWQKRWAWSVGALGLLSQETGYDLAAARDVRRTYEVGAIPLLLTYDRSNSLLDPTKGYRLTLTPSPEVSVGHGTIPYVRLLFDASAYEPITSALSLAERVRFGSIEGADSQVIAPSRRFYAGGGGSVRGFDYEALGPQSPTGQAVGGASVNEFSVEARYRLGDWGLASFIDGGQAYLQATPQLANLRYGVGAGVRYYTGFGPLRLDLATPLGRRPGETPVAVYISIGQAF